MFLLRLSLIYFFHRIRHYFDITLFHSAKTQVEPWPPLILSPTIPNSCCCLPVLTPKRFVILSWIFLFFCKQVLSLFLLLCLSCLSISLLDTWAFRCSVHLKCCSLSILESWVLCIGLLGLHDMSTIILSNWTTNFTQCSSNMLCISSVVFSKYLTAVYNNVLLFSYLLVLLVLNCIIPKCSSFELHLIKNRANREIKFCNKWRIYVT